MIRFNLPSLGARVGRGLGVTFGPGEGVSRGFGVGLEQSGFLQQGFVASYAILQLAGSGGYLAHLKYKRFSFSKNYIKIVFLTNKVHQINKKNTL